MYRSKFVWKFWLSIFMRSFVFFFVLSWVLGHVSFVDDVFGDGKGISEVVWLKDVGLVIDYSFCNNAVTYPGQAFEVHPAEATHHQLFPAFLYYPFDCVLLR